MTKHRLTRAGLAVTLLLGGAALAAAKDLESPGCLAADGVPVTVTDVDAALDIHLGDGRVVHLPGVAASENAAAAQSLLRTWLTQSHVTLRPVRSEADRWGRAPALLFAAPPADQARTVSVVEALLDAGFALARPDPDLDACWPRYLAIEERARQARRGRWAAASVIDPGNTADLEAHAGSFAIVAGRVAAVRTGRARLYLAFGQDRNSTMAAALSLALVRRMTKAGTDPRIWVGRALRVRGVIDDRWGWQIEVTTPQQLDVDPQ